MLERAQGKGKGNNYTYNSFLCIFVTLICIALSHIALLCVAFRCIALRCFASLFNALLCFALQCIAVFCICTPSHCVAMPSFASLHVALHSASRCIALLCITPGTVTCDTFDFDQVKRRNAMQSKGMQKNAMVKPERPHAMRRCVFMVHTFGSDKETWVL